MNSGRHTKGLKAISSNPTSLRHGFVEPHSKCADIVHALNSSIAKRSELFSQKYLYTTLHGARLWDELCHGTSHIAEVYKQFPLGVEYASEDKALRHNFIKAITRQWRERLTDLNEVSLFVLGAGTGEREGQIARWLSVKFKPKALRVLLIDLSSELLKLSLLRFSECCTQEISTRFALLDFQDPASSEALRHLREEEEDRPCLFVFLGNTFGNIDEQAFLKSIARVMRAQDLLLCELLLIEPQSATGVTPRHETRDDAYAAASDPRSPLVVNPLRALGLNPNPENLQRFLLHDPSRGVTELYRYVFDRKEAAQCDELSIDPTPAICEGASIDLLRIQSYTTDACQRLFGGIFSSVEIAKKRYEIGGRTICMGYVLSSHPRSCAPHMELREEDHPHDGSTLDNHAVLRPGVRLSMTGNERIVMIDAHSIQLSTTEYALLWVMAENYTLDHADANQWTVLGQLKDKLNALNDDAHRGWFDKQALGFVEKCNKRWEAAGSEDVKQVSQLLGQLRHKFKDDPSSAAQVILRLLPRGRREPCNLKLHQSQIQLKQEISSG